MRVDRREFVGWGAASLAGAALRGRPVWAAGKARFKVGVTDWNLGLEGRVESIALARKIGFDGVQISLGKGDDALPLADPALQKAFLDESKRVGLPLASVCLEILHRNYLKSHPLGQRWVADSIPIAKALGVKVVLQTRLVVRASCGAAPGGLR